MTLAAENANSKLVDAVAIADVDVDDAKESVNNRLTTANSLAAACLGITMSEAHNSTVLCALGNVLGGRSWQAFDERKNACNS